MGGEGARDRGVAEGGVDSRSGAGALPFSPKDSAPSTTQLDCEEVTRPAARRLSWASDR